MLIGIVTIVVLANVVLLACARANHRRFHARRRAAEGTPWGPIHDHFGANTK